jgi:hypothetical protein
MSPNLSHLGVMDYNQRLILKKMSEKELATF